MAGTMGACVEAKEMGGDPIVCHLVTTDRSEITDVSLVTWSVEQWDKGLVKMSANNPGKKVPGVVVDGSVVGYTSTFGGRNLQIDEDI